MTQMDTLAWRDYPMGPTVRLFLGISDDDYLGEHAEPPTEAKSDDFFRFLSNYIDEHPVHSVDELIALMEELTGMKMGYLALKLKRCNPSMDPAASFRGLLALGGASMLEQELDDAEHYLRDAQGLAPEEPAPYFNLAQMFFHQKRDQEALEWALAGLDAAPNHRGLWEMLALLYQAENPDDAGERIRKLADQRSSWAGASLAALLVDSNDAMLRAQWLEDLYNQGERDFEFLIEYTASLGSALQYEKIPPVVWQVEKLSSQRLPWQLYAHAGQAQLALDQREAAKKTLDQAMADPNLPHAVRLQLHELRDEINTDSHH